MIKTILLTLLLAISFNSFAETPATEEKPTYTVGVKPSGPFAYKQDGEWKGLSIDLIERMSEDLNFDYEFVEVGTITALLSLPEYNSTDMAIGAISMTDDREKVVDFSHPYFTTTVGMLVRENGNVFVFIIQRVAAAVAILIIALYVIGFIVSRLDPDDEIDNAHKGAWFVLVTFTTTGYGDYVPQNAKAKVFAGLLMITSLFALSAFTGYISSALTVEKLTDDPTTIQDLYNHQVATVAGSTSQELLQLLGINHRVVTSPELGVALVQKNQVKAFVYDKAMLDYLAQQGDDSLQVWPVNRGQERYAIAFQSGSELREDFNVSILNIVDSPEWKSTVAKYFGDQ